MQPIDSLIAASERLGRGVQEGLGRRGARPAWVGDLDRHGAGRMRRRQDVDDAAIAVAPAGADHDIAAGHTAKSHDTVLAEVVSDDADGCAALYRSPTGREGVNDRNVRRERSGDACE